MVASVVGIVVGILFTVFFRPVGSFLAAVVPARFYWPFKLSESARRLHAQVLVFGLGVGCLVAGVASLPGD